MDTGWQITRGLIDVRNRHSVIVVSEAWAVKGDDCGGSPKVQARAHPGQLAFPSSTSLAEYPGVRRDHSTMKYAPRSRLHRAGIDIIISDPAIHAGEPVVKGSRIPVASTVCAHNALINGPRFPRDPRPAPPYGSRLGTDKPIWNAELAKLVASATFPYGWVLLNVHDRDEDEDEDEDEDAGIESVE